MLPGNTVANPTVSLGLTSEAVDSVDVVALLGEHFRVVDPQVV